MEPRHLAVAVATSEEARERDRLAVEAGTPARVLMQNAGAAAAQRIVHHFGRQLSGGVEVHTGPGNNGGDGWVVAQVLAARGVPVRVIEAEPPRTPDAIDARLDAASIEVSNFTSRATVIVDALLGTGSRAGTEGKIQVAVGAINSAREQGAKVVSLDIPTGLDANSGAAHDPVIADLTLAFGTAKRGHLIAREVCGRLEVLDIGLGEFAHASMGGIALASSGWVAPLIPRIAANAHKGTRKRLAIIAGDEGMAGAAILAGRGALRSGIGLLHMIVARENRAVVHAAIPEAVVFTHDEFISDPAVMLLSADAAVVGPGLRPEHAAKFLAAIPAAARLIVLDAGALTAFNSDTQSLKSFCAGREVVLTPHPAEMGRLAGVTTTVALERRFEIGHGLAYEIGATVLLKGTPTIVSHPGRGRIASAAGTAALATGGSGDILSGMIGTLLAQTENGFESAVCAAWVHGRAAELCGSVRGVTLDDVLFAMPAAWRHGREALKPPVLATLPFLQ